MRGFNTMIDDSVVAYYFGPPCYPAYTRPVFLIMAKRLA